MKNDDKKEKMINWLNWARKKADWPDPLPEKEDSLSVKGLKLKYEDF